MDEIRYFREKIPSAQYVPVRAKAPTPPLPDYEPTYRVIDGSRSIEELGRLTGRGELAITKDVYGLERSGHVLIQAPRRAGDPDALIHLGNRLLGAIHSEADAAGKGRELRKGLASFASAGSGAYGVLFANAGPAVDGAFDPKRVVTNLQRLAQDSAVRDSAEATLRRMLYEYVSFAIFCVGAAAGRQREEALSAHLSAELTELEPQ
jgi:hypothetical protein